MKNKNKQLKEIHKLPDGEIIIPFDDAKKLPPELNPYEINPFNPITPSEDI